MPRPGGAMDGGAGGGACPADPASGAVDGVIWDDAPVPPGADCGAPEGLNWLRFGRLNAGTPWTPGDVAATPVAPPPPTF
jgi:hypothetical protein